jgi:hypothetical protein
MRRVRCRRLQSANVAQLDTSGRQRTQTRAKRGKALYDPYAGIMAITAGGYKRSVG